MPPETDCQTGRLPVNTQFVQDCGVEQPALIKLPGLLDSDLSDTQNQLLALGYIRFQMLTTITSTNTTGQARVLFNSKGGAGNIVTVSYTPGFATTDLYIPIGAQGTALGGVSSGWRILTHEKPSMLVLATIVGSNYTVTYPCSTATVTVKNMVPLHVRDDNFFPYRGSTSAIVFNDVMHHALRTDTKVILTFMQSLLLRMPGIPGSIPYFISSVPVTNIQPNCVVAPGGDTQALVVIPSPI
jgi:hypothetical protein